MVDSEHDYSNLSTTQQLTLIATSAYSIGMIPNPTLHAQSYIVRNHIHLFGLIDNPLEEVQLYAVAHHPDCYDHIKNPSQEVTNLHKAMWCL